MKLYILSLGLVIFTGVLFAPHHSNAYSVTNQSAIDLGNGKALFSITYKFGFLNRELYMPIVTRRGGDTKTEVVSYELFTGSTVASTTGTMAGLVLSDAEIKNNTYYLPKGKSAEFTFVTVVNVPTTGIKKDLSVVITDLPFTMIDGSMKIGAEVADEELKAFKTSNITLK